MTKMHSISIIAKRVSPESREEAQQIISSLTYKNDTSVFDIDELIALNESKKNEIYSFSAPLYNLMISLFLQPLS